MSHPRTSVSVGSALLLGTVHSLVLSWSSVAAAVSSWRPNAAAPLFKLAEVERIRADSTSAAVLTNACAL